MKGVVPTVFSSIALAVVGVVVKLTGESVHSLSLNAMRLVLAFLTVLIILPFVDSKFLMIKKSDLPHYVLIGLLLAFSTSSFVASLQRTTIASAVLIIFTAPFFLMIFSHFFLKEKVTKKMIAITLLAFAGIVIMNPLQKEQLFGNALAFSAAIFGAATTAYMRHEEKTHSVGTIFWFLLFATIFLMPSIFIYGTAGVTENIHWILLLGVFTGIAYLFYTEALEYLNAVITSMIGMVVEPLVAIFLAFIVLNEVPTIPTMIGGGLLIFGGVLLQERILKKQKGFNIHKIIWFQKR